MADIEFYKGKYRSYLIAVSLEGTRWLQQNISFKDRAYNSNVEVVVSINTEHYDDMLKALEETGLEIDAR